VVNFRVLIRALRAAGLWGQHRYAIDAQGVVEFADDVPRGVREQVLAVVAAHDPEAPAPPSDMLKADREVPVSAVGDTLAALLKKSVLALEDLSPAVRAWIERRAAEKDAEVSHADRSADR